MALGRRIRALAVAALPLAGAGRAGAELLPLRTYSAADGLAHDRVKRIAVDRDGFVWFCTLEGLSRFDGRRFVNFGTADGLPVPSTNDLLETDHGFWVATNGAGVVFFDPDAPRAGLRVLATGTDAASRVNVLALDGKGTLWAGTDGGLFRLDGAGSGAEGKFVRVPLAIPGRDDASVHVSALLARPAGLLVGTTHGLVFVGAGGARRVPLAGDAPGSVLALAEGDGGRALVGRGDGQGLEVLDEALRPVLRRAPPKDLPSGVVTALLVSRGRVTVGTDSGLAILAPEGARSVGTREGLPDGAVSSLAEDRDGGLWIGSPQGGVARLLSSASAVFDESGGFGRAARLFSGPGGAACGVSAGWRISCFDGRSFSSGAPRFAAALPASAWRGYFGALYDHEGGLWLASPAGLYRFPKLLRIEELDAAAPAALYTARDGLASDSIAALLEDGAGDVWIGSFAPARDPLTVWRRATGRFERLGAAAGLPDFGSPAVLGLDAAGSVWISYRDGTLARHCDGRFRVVSGRNGFPVAFVKGMASDPAGRLWAIADGGSLVRVDEPGAGEPKAVVYGRGEGVTGWYLSGLVVDAAGRVVFGTGRELLRLDPTTGEIGRVLPDRVLLQSEPSSAFRDRDGALWFATWRGTVRIAPTAESGAPVPPRVRISGVTVSGVERRVPGRGVASLDLGELPSSANVSFEFFGLGAFGQPLAYAYALEGLDGKWSGPQEGGSVHFASFPAGRYRFRVRAGGTAGAPEREASATFSVAVPVWRRGWFLAAFAVLFSCAGYGARALQARARRRMEEARRRIASDLHDDLGAGLSRIGILSEVATLAVQSGARPDDAIAKIREASREVDERLAEGIWTVDPAHDSLAGLCRRLCLLAAELLEPAGIAWRVETPEDAERIRLSPDRRREIYLLLKEGFANAARHSGARHAVLTVASARGRISFRLADDGKGYDATAPDAPERLSGGRGRRTMRARADALGGTLRVESGPGGTNVVLDVPTPDRA
jgi:signal transduction histidine kinase/ligand-binding sensor domain-containing protein